MRRITLAALAAAVAIPMFAIPAAAQDYHDYGFTPSDDFPYHWGERRGPRYDDPRADRRQMRGYEGDYDERAYREEHGPRYRDEGRRGYRDEDYAQRGYPRDRGYGDADFRRDYREDGRRGYYQDPAYERMRHEREMYGEPVGMRDDRGAWSEMNWRHGYHMAGRDRGPRRGGRDMRAMRRAEEMMATYDTDGDGQVTQAEIDKYRSDRVAEFDSDGDGALTLQEYERLWLDAMRERMVDRFQHHDDDGDGRITVEEFSSRTHNLVRMRDRDGDEAFSFGDLGPRGGEEWRRMRDRRAAADRDETERPEVQASPGRSSGQPEAPAAEDDSNGSDSN